MASQVGISDAQAHKLIELAKEHGLTAKVRTFRKNSSQHAGRAFLFEVTSPGYARIQPLTHRKEEVVELSTLRLWKSGNDFDTQEVYDMEGSPAIIEATGEPVTTSTRYVIFSKKTRGLWSESRAMWIQNIKNASRWNVHEKEKAEQLLQKIRKAPVHDDAELLPEADGVFRLQSIILESSRLAIPERAPSSMNVSPFLVSSPSNSAFSGDDDLLDLDALLKADDTLLRQAENERKKAMEEYLATKKALREITAKLRGMNDRVVELGGRSILKSSSNPAPANTGKRIYMRCHIKNVLLSSSRLDAQSIFDRIQGVSPSITLQKTKQSLLTMKVDGIAEKDENDNWALTDKGRSAKMIGEK